MTAADPSGSRSLPNRNPTPTGDQLQSTDRQEPAPDWSVVIEAPVHFQAQTVVSNGLDILRRFYRLARAVTP